MASIAQTGILKLAIVAAVTLAYASPVYAYLDPGTGSIILQSLLAGVAVAVGFLRLYWHRFKTFLASLTGTNRETENDDTDIARDTDAGNSP